MDKVQALDIIVRSAIPHTLSVGQTKPQFPHLYNGDDDSVFFIVST